MVSERIPSTPDLLPGFLWIFQEEFFHPDNHEDNFKTNTQHTAPVCRPLPGQTCQISASSPQVRWWSWNRPRQWSGWWRALGQAVSDCGKSSECCRLSHRRLSSGEADLSWSWTDSSSHHQRRKFSAGMRQRGRCLQTKCADESPCDETEEPRESLKTTSGLGYESPFFYFLPPPKENVLLASGVSLDTGAVWDPKLK